MITVIARIFLRRYIPTKLFSFLYKVEKYHQKCKQLKATKDQTQAHLRQMLRTRLLPLSDRWAPKKSSLSLDDPGIDCRWSWYNKLGRLSLHGSPGWCFYLRMMCPAADGVEDVLEEMDEFGGEWTDVRVGVWASGYYSIFQNYH